MTNITNRQYYTDAYTVTFTARVVETMRRVGHTAVVLDQTYFYPESGGQPADKGTLDGHAVIDVTVREADQAVLHWVDEAPTADTVRGEINWSRRFDHMQQHTGQHILSRAFINTAEAETVSFHLGQAICTIDLHAGTRLTAVDMHRAEQVANQIVWENRPLTARFVTQAEADNLPLRKQPAVAGDTLRLIDIADFDLTACGGTHVARTGEVGLIKILKLEKRKKKWRVTFVCGQRAVADYEAKNQVVQDLTAELTTAPEALLHAVQKIQAEGKAARRTVCQLRETLAQYEVDAYRQAAERVAETDLIVLAVDDRDGAALRTLVQALLTDPPRPTVVLAGVAGEKPAFICQRSETAPGEMKRSLKAGLAVLGSQSGGGTAVVAQGSAPPATLAQVQAALSAARANWLTAVL